MEKIGLVKYLEQELARRKSRNSSYSLRAFSRDLGIDSSNLSAILSQKKTISAAYAKIVLDSLNIEAELKVELLLGVIDQQLTATPKYFEIDEDTYNLIIGWEHFAIISLIATKDFRGNIDWIANRLGTDSKTVSDAVHRLKEARLIEVREEKWKIIQNNLATKSDIPSSAVREGIRQYIYKAIEALEDTPLEERDISGMTMAIDTSKIPDAKKMIASFRRRLCKFLESDGLNSDEVYRLNIQLFPVTSTKSNNFK